MFVVPKFITPETWKSHVNLAEYGLSFGDENFSYKLTGKTNERVFALLQKLEENLGVTFLTIPQGLSLEILQKIGQNPLHGNKVRLSTAGISDEILRKRTEKTYTVIMTNTILEGTRKKSNDEQKVIIEGLDAEMQGGLEAAALAVMAFIAFNISFFAPRTYTHCSEKGIVVGGFEGDLVTITVDDLAPEIVGAGAMIRC